MIAATLSPFPQTVRLLNPSLGSLPLGRNVYDRLRRFIESYPSHFISESAELYFIGCTVNEGVKSRVEGLHFSSFLFFIVIIIQKKMEVCNESTLYSCALHEIVIDFRKHALPLVERLQVASISTRLYEYYQKSSRKFHANYRCEINYLNEYHQPPLNDTPLRNWGFLPQETLQFSSERRHRPIEPQRGVCLTNKRKRIAGTRARRVPPDRSASTKRASRRSLIDRWFIACTRRDGSGISVSSRASIRK